jgi:hypothetical protein
MTTSFENLNRIELLRKRETLYYYIEKINKELEKRDAKQTVNDRLDRDLEEMEKANTNPVTLAFKKLINNKKIKDETNKKAKEGKSAKTIEKIIYVDRIENNKKKILVKKSPEKKSKSKSPESSPSKKKKLTITIIKKGLDNKKIKYKKSLKKAELMEIVRKNNLVRYVESLC